MITTTLRAKAALLAAIILSMTLAGTPGLAKHDDGKVAIFNAVVDIGAGEITITGQRFPRKPYVTFGGEVAVVLGTPTRSEIVIELPSGTPPGSYRVTVGRWWGALPFECFGEDDDCFEVAVLRTSGMRTVFVTSGVFNGDLAAAGGGASGLQGADDICNAHATIGIVPPGPYVAWLSTTLVDARDRLPANTVGYVLADGTTVVATSKADLLDGTLLSPIDQTETGAPPQLPSVWTASLFDGRRNLGSGTCLNWTSGTEEFAALGDSRFTGPFWTDVETIGNCSAVVFRLYCFER